MVYFVGSSLPVALAVSMALTVLLTPTQAQNAADEKQLDPNASCDQTTRDQITTCLDQIETDESKLASGPCSSSDWTCICTKQVGLQDCYQNCRGLQPVDDVSFNKNNCFSQHGVDMSTLTYTWSQLAFTVDSGASRNQDTSSGGVAINSDTSGSSTSAPSSSSSTQSSSASSNNPAATSSTSSDRSSTSSSSAASTSSRSSTSTSGTSSLFPSSSPLCGSTALVLCAVLLGAFLL